MSDANLMAFGGAVSFIALSGIYVYLRECFTAGEAARSGSERRRSEVGKHEVREVA